MKRTISLNEWARRNGYSKTAAYRRYHNGTLPEGVRTHRNKRHIYVEIDVPDETITIDPHALVDHLTHAGYVILTYHQATQLGITGDTDERPRPPHPPLPD